MSTENTPSTGDQSAVFFDTHAHLDGKTFTDDLEPTLTRAVEAGLSHIVCIGASEGFESNTRALAIADRYPGLYATVGFHPHDASQVDASTLAKVEALTDHPRVVGIGETGLDYYYGHSARDEQIGAFRSFISIARSNDLACIVHTRDAEEDTKRILREEGASNMRGVIHCFTGTRDLALAALDLGWYISLSGVITFKNADDLRQTAKDLPRDRVLVETDCPYLAPVPFRGKRNEPAFVLKTAAVLAELWGVDLDTVRKQTGENALRLFRISSDAERLAVGTRNDGGSQLGTAT